MARERHTTAFVVGFVLGGAACAALTLWKTPRSGRQLRALIAERAEEVLFRLTGMDEAQQGSGALSTSPRLFAREAVGTNEVAPAASVTSPSEAVASAPVDEEPVVSVEGEDEARMPATFRGEVLTEQPTDIVLDGPRPAPAER